MGSRAQSKLEKTLEDMSEHYEKLKQYLYDFNIDKANMDDLKDSKNDEILNNGRFMKNEIIDIADQIDILSSRQKSLENKLDQIIHIIAPRSSIDS